MVDNSILPIIELSLVAARNKINKNNRRFCFEIFGYDFMIDKDLKPWLIEVNTNPCIEESSGLLKQLVPRMLDDALKLTLDQLFPPIKDLKVYKRSDEGQVIEINANEFEPVERAFHVDGYQDEQNMWGDPFYKFRCLL